MEPCRGGNKGCRAGLLGDNIPAISELRYAGRRIIEAIATHNTDDAKALQLLRDAYFDCCRARHDAVDAASAKIAETTALAVEKIGPALILQYFPEITELNSELAKIRALVQKSRCNRDDRDNIYETIQNDNLDTIINLYEKYRANEDLLKAAAEKEKAELESSRKAAKLTIMAGVASLLAAVVAVWLDLLHG